jgi:low affinity Fe/Cu permease
MKKKQQNPLKSFGDAMERFSHFAMEWTGSTPAFLAAVALLLAWLLTGPLFQYSDTWQLVINTFTTIVTFLMVFLIQRAQNKDSKAVALKLNEIIAALEGASNRMIGVERLSEAEIKTLQKHYDAIIAIAERESTLGESHSIEEARRRAEAKSLKRKKGLAGSKTTAN